VRVEGGGGVENGVGVGRSGGVDGGVEWWTEEWSATIKSGVKEWSDEWDWEWSGGRIVGSGSSGGVGGVVYLSGGSRQICRGSSLKH
jgi:hypothetical protein